MRPARAAASCTAARCHKSLSSTGAATSCSSVRASPVPARPRADKRPASGGITTVSSPSRSASCAPCSPPAPPNATSAWPFKAIPCRSVTPRIASAIVSLASTNSPSQRECRSGTGWPAAEMSSINRLSALSAAWTSRGIPNLTGSIRPSSTWISVIVSGPPSP